MMLLISIYIDGQELASVIVDSSDAGRENIGMVCFRCHVMLFMRVFVVMKFSIQIDHCYIQLLSTT